MADKDSGHVPTWNGEARTWRRFTREIGWYIRATPQHKRRYCATKIISRLTGPARLLAMSWANVDFDSAGGTKKLLRLLAASPLVRQALPNAAAICSQYFSFKRHQGEAMNSFLVREALGYSEFVEAISRLHEDKLGIKQEEKDFGLPDDAEEWDEWDEWWPDPEEPPPDDEEDSKEDQDPKLKPSASTTSAAAGPQDMGGSPSHHGSAGTPTVVKTSPAQSKPLDELSLADSFVLGVLRGFRLLQAAGLNPDEKRDIISTTKGSLEFETVTQALQTLWDDQLLGGRTGSFGQQAMFQELYASQAADDWWEDDESWNWHAYVGTDDWSSWDYDLDENYGFHAYEESWNEEPVHELQAQTQTDSGEPEADSSKSAEGMALEQRTWTEAQRAQAALRKDRGFGHVTGKGQPRPACFKCGSTQHLARECPDRMHPQFHKGKSKGYSSFYTDYSPVYDTYMIGKGKGKTKSKSPSRPAHLHAMWKGKGKSKTKALGRPAVNAYAMEPFYMNGLEIHESLTTEHLNAASSANVSPGEALIDSGATASAGPEESVKVLIQALLSFDPGASIDVQPYARPYFRFGNGRWGQALYRVVLSQQGFRSSSSVWTVCFAKST